MVYNAEQIFAQDYYFLYENVIKISSSFSDETSIPGFGFILYESGSSVYAVTAKHVVLSSKSNVETERIQVNFYDSPLTEDARLDNYDDQLDLALIVFKKPKGLLWEYKDIVRDIQVNDNIRIIGRYRTWNISAKEASGYVTQISAHEFKAKFSCVAVGSSGGPVLCGNKIVGMAINDDGKQIFAIPIKLIRQRVVDWLRLKDLEFSDLLSFSVGVCGDLSTYYVPFVQLDNVKVNPVLNFGAFSEVSFSKHFSFQTEIEYGKIGSKANPDYTPDYRFRNNFSSVSVSLLYHPRTNLHSYDMAYIKVGYSFVKMNPEINIEQNGWVDLESLGSSLHNYSNNAGSFNIGLGGGPLLTKNIYLRIELIYKYFTSKYLYIDILEPYNVNKKNDWLLTFGMKLDFVFRPKSSKIKFLR
jgi:hypothetical protein